jgi:hypothetical protein
MASAVDSTFECPACGRKFAWSVANTSRPSKCVCGHVWQVPNQSYQPALNATPTQSHPTNASPADEATADPNNESELIQLEPIVDDRPVPNLEPVILPSAREMAMSDRELFDPFTKARQSQTSHATSSTENPTASSTPDSNATQLSAGAPALESVSPAPPLLRDQTRQLEEITNLNQSQMNFVLWGTRLLLAGLLIVTLSGIALVSVELLATAQYAQAQGQGGTFNQFHNGATLALRIGFGLGAFGQLMCLFVPHEVGARRYVLTAWIMQVVLATPAPILIVASMPAFGSGTGPALILILIYSVLLLAIPLAMASYFGQLGHFLGESGIDEQARSTQRATWGFFFLVVIGTPVLGVIAAGLATFAMVEDRIATAKSIVVFSSLLYCICLLLVFTRFWTLLRASSNMIRKKLRYIG